MAQHIIGETRSLRDTPSHALSLSSIVKIRLISALIITFSSLICFVGKSWDIQWHAFVGRDRALIPLHEMMLTGIAALVLVITETKKTSNTQDQLNSQAGLVDDGRNNDEYALNFVGTADKKPLWSGKMP